MRWDNLFDDLEGQLETGIGAEDIDLRAEEERLRLGRMTVRDRLLALCSPGVEPADTADRIAAEPRGIRIELINGTTVTVRPHAFGRDWISGDLVEESRRNIQFVLPLHAVAGLVLDRAQMIASVGDPVVPEPARGLSRRLGLAFVLRDVCRRRTALTVETSTGVVYGTIDRVGRDHFDVAVHEAGSVRRERAVSEYRVILFDQVLLVRL
jgi:hypothetical protein